MKYDLLLMKSLNPDTPLSKEEVDFVNKRAARQSIIRFLYMEHINLNRKQDEPELTDFHVSLGDGAEKYSIVDTVLSLIKVYSNKNETLDFGDFKFVGTESPSLPF